MLRLNPGVETTTTATRRRTRGVIPRADGQGDDATFASVQGTTTEKPTEEEHNRKAYVAVGPAFAQEARCARTSTYSTRVRSCPRFPLGLFRPPSSSSEHRRSAASPWRLVLAFLCSRAEPGGAGRRGQHSARDALWRLVLVARGVLALARESITEMGVETAKALDSFWRGTKAPLRPADAKAAALAAASAQVGLHSGR